MDARVEKSRTSPTRVLLAWCAAVLMLVLVFTGGVVALNATVFSPGGFVTTYLQTLGAKDVDGALSMPGVELPDDVTPKSLNAALLTRDTLSSISDISVDDDTELSAGVHRVTMTYTLEGARRESKRTQSEFIVEQQGNSYGVFSGWRFKESPVGTLSLAVTNATSVTVGSRELDAADLGADKGAFGAGARFPVLVPALVVLSHDSYYLSSDTQAVAVTQPGATEDGVIKPQPTEAFTTAVTQQLTSFLDDCAAQKALFPVGCPFSHAVSDRIQGDPSWSIVKYPQIQLVAGPASWLLSDNVGTAHIDVQVKSLFDGSVTALSQDVPFSLNYAVNVDDDQQITFAPRT